ncbi:unnamed protein product [Polarella glacialis]|uniref:Pentacotripeptide-repeat region of PRORP domain-containing protein n=1 Tax=Polarella glacialis TaxID=89957 RepID=A0A813GJE1_POLGL|nr:unnamed protein product [Polarella glacialis]CAE8688523.1 unnamed protein product [Polarella glacialis]
MPARGSGRVERRGLRVSAVAVGCGACFWALRARLAFSPGLAWHSRSDAVGLGRAASEGGQQQQQQQQPQPQPPQQQQQQGQQRQRQRLADSNSELLRRLSAGEVGPEELARALQQGRMPQGKRNWEWGLEVLRRFRETDTVAEAATYTAVLKACEVGKAWQPAVALLGEMLSAGQAVDEQTYTAVIRACDGCAKWEWALTLLDDMSRNLLDPPAAAFGACISACDRGGQTLRTLKLLDSMRQRDLSPSSITYSLAIGACKKKLYSLVKQVQSKKTSDDGGVMKRKRLLL